MLQKTNPITSDELLNYKSYQERTKKGEKTCEEIPLEVKNTVFFPSNLVSMEHLRKFEMCSLQKRDTGLEPDSGLRKGK